MSESIYAGRDTMEEDFGSRNGHITPPDRQSFTSADANGGDVSPISDVSSIHESEAIEAVQPALTVQTTEHPLRTNAYSPPSPDSSPSEQREIVSASPVSPSLKSPLEHPPLQASKEASSLYSPDYLQTESAHSLAIIPPPPIVPSIDDDLYQSRSENTSSELIVEHTPLPVLSASNLSPFRSATVELRSVSATASAFAESLGLSISAEGNWIVAYNSAALYLLLAEDLPFFHTQACRALRLRKKPLAVAVTDIGFLAILTSTYNIDVYRSGDGSMTSLHAPIERVQTVLLDNEAKAICLSPQGDMVAAGSDQGVEIVALGVPQGSSSDRRKINCGYPLDWIAFSNDAKSLLATGPAASRRRTPTSILLTISGTFDEGFDIDGENQPQQPIPKQWISKLIFPEKVRAGQTTFLPDNSAGSNEEILAFNSKAARFGIYDTALKQFNGKVLGFPEGIDWKCLDRYEDVLPGVSTDGYNVAIAVAVKGEEKGGEIWTYQVESSWREEDLAPTSAGSGRSEPSQSKLLSNHRFKMPSTDEYSSAEYISSLRWAHVPSEQGTATSKRLIVLVNTPAVSIPDELAPTDHALPGAKILIFNYPDSDDVVSIDRNGQEELKHQTVIVNLDDFPLSEDLAPGEVALEREVDIVRRRTQNQRSQKRSHGSGRSQQSPLPRRAATAAPRSSNSGNRQSTVSSNEAAFPNPDDLHRDRRSRAEISPGIGNGNSGASSPTVAAVEEPYSHSAPRSQYSLQRAATAAQNSPAARMHLRALPSRPLEYRPANGNPVNRNSQIAAGPGNEDDNWIPPPPPYSERPDNVASLPIETIPGVADAVLRGQIRTTQPQQGSNRMRARMSQVVSVPSPVQGPQQSSQRRATASTQGPRSTTATEAARAPVQMPLSGPASMALPVSQSRIQSFPQSVSPSMPQPLPQPTAQTTMPPLPQTISQPMMQSINQGPVVLPTSMMAPIQPRSNFPAIQADQRSSTFPIGLQPTQSTVTNRHSTIGPGGTLQIPLMAASTGQILPSSAPVTPIDPLRRSRTSYGLGATSNPTTTVASPDSRLSVHQPVPVSGPLRAHTTRQQSAQQLAEQHYEEQIRRQQTNGNANRRSVSTISPMSPNHRSTHRTSYMASTSERSQPQGISPVDVSDPSNTTQRLSTPQIPQRWSSVAQPSSDSPSTRPMAQDDLYNAHHDGHSPLHVQSNGHLRSLTHGHFTRQEANSSRSLSRLEGSSTAPLTSSGPLTGTGRRHGQWWRMGGEKGNRSRSWSALGHRDETEMYRRQQEKEKKCVVM